MLVDWGNKLYELFDAIVILVKVTLLGLLFVIVQGYGAPLTKHEPDVVNADVLVRRFLLT